MSLRCACTKKPFLKRSEGRGFIYREVHIKIFPCEHEPMPKLNIKEIYSELAEHSRKKINDDDVLEVTRLNCGHTCIDRDIPNAVSQPAL